MNNMTLVDIAFLVVTGACIIGLLICVFLLIKNNNAFKNTITINHAIYSYISDCIYKRTEPTVDYSDMRSYDRTWLRFWDWGYKHILPKEKFKIIEPYINEELPSCFGDPMCYHNKAEYGCDSCRFAIRCDLAREEEEK